MAFAVSAASSIIVLVPRKNLVFTTSGTALYEGLYEFRDDVPEAYRRLAYELDLFWEENDRALAPLFRWFRVAAIALAAEVLLLLAAVSGTLW